MAINDTIQAQAEELIVAAVKARFPEIDLRPGTPQYDLHVLPYLAVVTSLVEQIQRAERKRTPIDPAELTDEEADAHAQKFFVERHEGSPSVGTVRAKFKEPFDARVATDSAISQDDKFTYHPTMEVAVAAGQMAKEPTLGYYYFDIPAEADENGEDYDALVGTTFKIDAFDGDPNFIEAIASSPFIGGKSGESNEDLLARARKGQTVRNFVNPTSIETRLNEKFPGIISRMQVIGYQEPEMRRDLKSIVDPMLGNIKIHLGNHTDIYVQTPIIRRTFEIEVPAGEAILDLSEYRALLKIHSVTDKSAPDDVLFYALVDQDPATRYSAIDEVKLLIDPAFGGRTILVDMSYAPDVVTLNDYVNGPDEHITLANLLVRYLHPVWLSANIYVDGVVGRENDVRRAINKYIGTVSGNDLLVVSKITDAIHDANVGSVHQDFDVTANIHFGNGEFLELSSETVLEIPNRYEWGFSQRIAAFINEGIVITALS